MDTFKMNIPIAPVSVTDVNSGIILDDNTDNIIHINIKAKQLINQTAFLEVSEVSQLPDTQSGGNYDNDSLRMNVYISSPITNTIPRSLPSRTTEVIEYDGAPISRRNNRRHPNGRNNPEGKMFVAFIFIVVMIIIIFVKMD